MLKNKLLFTKKHYLLGVILAAGSLTTMVGAVIAPVLPDMINQLGLDPVLAGNLISIHCLTIAIFSPLLGIVADKFSPVKVLVPCLLAYGILGTLGAWLPSIWSLLITRALLGAASGGIAASALGLLAQMYEGEKRTQAIGYVSSTLTITGMIFPLLGGWLGAINWQYAFFLYGIAIPIAVLAFTLFSGYSHPRRPSHSSKREGGKLSRTLLQRNIWSLLVNLAIASLIMYAMVIYTPLYLSEQLGIGPQINGLILATRALGAAIISAFGTKKIVYSLGNTRTIALGFTLMTFTVVTIPLLTQLSLIILSAVIFGLGFGLVIPNLYDALALFAPTQFRSSILAAGTGANFLGQFCAPIILGPILGLTNLETVFYAIAILAMIGGLFSQLQDRENNAKTTTN